jgi:DNA helicase-2/ATP-dependent DNA helicase PcrA
MFELSEQKKNLLETDSHILVLGGPGSGKTTIALLKAKQVIEKGINNEQHVLFLSFARATVARVEQAIVDLKISRSARQYLETNTYHGFAWDILRSHGYLLNQKSPLRLLPPPEAAARLADVDGDAEREIEKYRLLEEEGLLHFDLFARLSAELLLKSKSLAAIYCDTYPVIIFDEFQDTNSDEWALIKVLGEKSTLIALADPEQRIYEFRGANPARIGQFIFVFEPKVFDFGSENNRSYGTDIVQFGNDLLTGANKRKIYENVKCKFYPYRQGVGMHLDLKTTVIEAYQRLKGGPQDKWSLAILVPSNNFMMEVSAYLSEPQLLSNSKRLPSINHEVAQETAGLALSAILIAGLLESDKTEYQAFNQFIHDLCEHIRGRRVM